MFYKIVEVSTDKASGHTYVLVHFWQSRKDFTLRKSPYRKNDFLMQLRSTGTRLIDEDNPALGSEAFDRDLPAEIRTNIEAYWKRALILPLPFDHTSHRIERDERDPHGVLARPDVRAMRGREIERP